MNMLSVGAGSSLLALCFVSLVPLTTSPDDRGRHEYEITIHNITRSQIFAPALVATHDSDVALYRLGEAASPELALLAEDGDNGLLRSALERMSGIEDVTSTDGGIPPGESLSVRIRTRGRRDRLSLASMLVSTNDSFVGLAGLDLDSKSSVVYLPAYDAGSEFNSEDCAKIPGPPCGNGGVRDTVDAEGRVYVSNGIQGQASLDPAVFDWNNPVAMVEIRRLDGRDGDDDDDDDDDD